MAGCSPCCAGLVAPFTESFGLSVQHPVNDRSRLNGTSVQLTTAQGNYSSGFKIKLLFTHMGL